MKQNKKDITIYDIAKHFNVSPSTVSRALKEHPGTSKKTAAKIQKYAQEHNYQTNSIAAQLRNRRSYTIGVMVTWIDRPFISSLISGIETIANQNGFNVIIAQTRDEYDLEVSIAKTMLTSRVEGLIVSLAMSTVRYDHFEQFANSGIPVVFTDRVPEHVNSNKVTIDNYRSAFIATEHLIKEGCTRIAHYGGSENRFIYRERLRGFIAALKTYDLQVDERFIIKANRLSAEEGTKISRQILSLPDRPDGIFAANDTSAISAIQCAQEMNIPVPKELAVVGFNDDPIASIISPNLTTISHPGNSMGEIAAKCLLENKSQQPESVVLDTKLIIRGSSLRSQENGFSKLPVDPFIKSNTSS